MRLTLLPFFFALAISTALKFKCIEDFCLIEDLNLQRDGTFVFGHIRAGIKQLIVTRFQGHTFHLSGPLGNLTSLQHLALEHSQVAAANLTLTAERSSVDIMYGTLRSLTFFECRGIQKVNVLHTLLASVPETLRGQTSLEELSIQHSRIGTVDFELFVSLPRLRILNLSDNKLHTLSIAPETGCCRRLAYLELHGNLLRRFDFGLLASMACLNFVSLRRNRLYSIENTHQDDPSSTALPLSCTEDQTEREAGPGAPFGNLLQIDLYSNRLNEVNFSVFASMRNLADIWLGRNSLTNVIAAAEQLPKGLAYIYLSCNRLARVELGALATVKSLDLGIVCSESYH